LKNSFVICLPRFENEGFLGSVELGGSKVENEGKVDNLKLYRKWFSVLDLFLRELQVQVLDFLLERLI
jgi:hypothetical protein